MSGALFVLEEYPRLAAALRKGCSRGTLDRSMGLTRSARWLQTGMRAGRLVSSCEFPGMRAEGATGQSYAAFGAEVRYQATTAKPRPVTLQGWDECGAGFMRG